MNSAAALAARSLAAVERARFLPPHWQTSAVVLAARLKRTPSPTTRKVRP